MNAEDMFERRKVFTRWTNLSQTPMANSLGASLSEGLLGAHPAALWGGMVGAWAGL